MEERNTSVRTAKGDEEEINPSKKRYRLLEEPVEFSMDPIAKEHSKNMEKDREEEER